MNLETVRIVEELRRGTRGGPYVYAKDGSELVHVGDYAAKNLPGERGDEIVYEIPKNEITGKELYSFDFSRTGSEFLGSCEIEDFENGRPRQYKHHGLLADSISEIEGLEFRIKDPTLKILLKQFKEGITPMVQEITRYETALGFGISFMGHVARLANAIRNPKVYYFTFMSLPSDASRISSFKVTRRWVYQLWVLKSICEALQITKFKGHEYDGKPYWWVEQGSEFSTGIGEGYGGAVTFWMEYQPTKGAHVAGMLAGRRISVRPDIVVSKGYFERTKEFIDSGNPMDMLVECKEDLYDNWKNGIESQILSYQKTFSPKSVIVVSLEPVPDTERANIESRGIKVIDNMKPGGKNVEMLYAIVRGSKLGMYG